jgi:hypothetical protein
MASYKGHLAFSSALGAACGAFGWWYLGLDWGAAVLGAGLTAVGGLLPDLDSDSGVPVREMFNLAGTFAPLLLLRRLHHSALTTEQVLVIMIGIYLFVRFGVKEVFMRWTVHRGMFHSVPAMLIAGLAVYLMHHGPDERTRLYLAGGTMVGFLSHLVLDEIYSVNFMGVGFKLNKYAGSALKVASPSWSATASAYVILAGLAFAAWVDYEKTGHSLAQLDSPLQHAER